MDTGKVVIVVIGVVLVGGGLFYLRSLTSDPNEPQDDVDETALLEDQDDLQEDMTKPDAPMDSPPPPARPSPRPTSTLAVGPIGPNSRASSATVRHGKPAPGAGAVTSGPRGNRPGHLPSTVSAAEVAQAEQTIATSDDPAQLERAMVTLTRDRDKANIEFFIAMLRDESEDPIVRSKAAEGLAMIGAQQALPYLLEAMSDESWRVRARANAAFVRLGMRDFGFDAKAPLEDREAVLKRIHSMGGQRPPSN